MCTDARMNVIARDIASICEIHIHHLMFQDIEMNAMILSAQFWPAFRDEKITLPLELQQHLDKYTKAFEMQKQNRTLLWKPHLGWSYMPLFCTHHCYLLFFFFLICFVTLTSPTLNLSA